MFKEKVKIIGPIVFNVKGASIFGSFGKHYIFAKPLRSAMHYK